MTEAAETKTFRLSSRLTVEITLGLGGMACEWSPRPPTAMTAKELKRYRAARDAMLARLAERTGLRVAVVET